MLEFEFTARLFRWEGKAAWHFIALPADMSQDLASWTRPLRAGWGSIRVRATIGSTSWDTSIFPDAARGTYLLPVKAQVRAAEGLDDGDEVDVTLTV